VGVLNERPSTSQSSAYGTRHWPGPSPARFELIAHLPARSGWVVAIIDRIGRVIADSHHAVGGQIIPLRPSTPVDGAEPGNVSARVFQLEGGEYIGSIVDISEIGWKELVAQLRSEAFLQISSTFWAVCSGVKSNMIFRTICLDNLTTITYFGLEALPHRKPWSNAGSSLSHDFVGDEVYVMILGRFPRAAINHRFQPC
jgi:hypothetical protein